MFANSRADVAAASTSPRDRSLPISDIAGENKANPLATLQSFAMMLRYSFDDGENADLIEQGVKNVLDLGLRTPDIMQDGKELVSCNRMGEALCEELDRLAA